MLYLAKVQRDTKQNVPYLLLIAYQSDEQQWVALPTGLEETLVPVEEAKTYRDGDPVLLELDSSSTVMSVQDATECLLDLVRQYFSAGLTPKDLTQEAARIEEWRKSLTLKSQDVVRQTLEVETRRDQIQELETKLEQERKQMELMTLQLQTLETRLEDERKQLNVISPTENTDTRLPDPTNTLG